MKCSYVYRVPVHPSVKVGGVSVGECGRQALPGLVFCEFHADLDVVRIRMNTLAEEAEFRNVVLRVLWELAHCMDGLEKGRWKERLVFHKYGIDWPDDDKSKVANPLGTMPSGTYRVVDGVLYQVLPSAADEAERDRLRAALRIAHEFVPDWIEAACQDAGVDPATLAGEGES